MTSKSWLVFAWLTGAVAAWPLLGVAADGIEAERGEAYALCRTMTAPGMAGRLTGHAGYTAAAHWAAGEFGRWGLGTLPGQEYLLPFAAPHSVIASAGLSFVLPASEQGKPGETRKLELQRDFFPLFFSAAGSRTAGAVFAGWGISAPELGYDDYAGLDVRGKFVFCFRGVPVRDDPRFDWYDEHRHRMATAAKRGAAGLIYLYPEVQGNPNGDRIAGLLCAEVSYAAADPLFAGWRKTSREVLTDLTASRRPLSGELPGQVSLTVEAEHFPEAEGFNVAAMIPGSDARFAGEWLVVGAHFDGCGTHLGMVFPGADDNASGSAAVMAMAHALARSGVRLPRPVVFVLFGGEEQGLRGSEAFAGRLRAWGIERVHAMINFDMVGEGDGIGCGFGAGDLPWDELFARVEGDLGRPVPHRLIRAVGVRGSDFAPFFRQGIPCVSFWSNGPHLAYHLPGGTLYRLNPEVLDDAVRTGLAVLTVLAGGDTGGRLPPRGKSSTIGG